MSRGPDWWVRLGVAALALGVLATLIVLLGRRATTGQQPPTVYLHGIDVSSHEPSIDWAAAARSGIRFVIARATEGDSRKDRNYRSIRQSAKAAGLAFSAFHFARPDRAKGDAVREADLFVAAAGLGPGDLAPVLDLEEHGRLGVARLQGWVRAWLVEVEAKVGVKPLIYTNADFWRTRMGDSTAFAEAGYPLYIASWNAPAPVVPADDWGGHGWTMWQSAKCGTVAGMQGCIRTDLYRGASLGPLTIG